MIVITTITQEDVSRVLDLQARAYETLLWLDHASLIRPHMLTDQTADILRNAGSCRGWITKHYHEIPQRLRPTEEEVEPFARLFSSFFQTSFRIELRTDRGVPYYRIAANKDEASGKKKLATRKVPRALKKKRRSEAERLKARALSLLIDSAEVTADAAIDALLDDEAMKRHVLAWTYVVELVERSRAESPGPSVHQLWKQMDTTAREMLTDYRIWKARQQLIKTLRTNQATSKV